MVGKSKTLRDYITEYQVKAKDGQIHKFAETLGLHENKLRQFMSLNVTIQNINEYGRFDDLKKKSDINLAKLYFDKLENKNYRLIEIAPKYDALIREFILKGGF